ncbi:MAG TPA: alpha/beta hydrolase [Streptosporangiaceae bacterium]
MDVRLETMYDRFTWRILANYVTPWEFEQLKKSIGDYGQWCRAWSAHAREHLTRGDEALAAGRTLTAGDAYIRAGLAYHWASFMFSHDREQFQAALAGMAEAWAKAAPHVSPPMELLTVPFEGLPLTGYLRVPAGAGPAPVVLLLPGGDSTKEELYNLAEHVLARGLAVAAFDGPGQGLLSLESTLRPDQEVAVMAIFDSLAERPDLDASRLAVGGISYGGLFAIRTAAADDRVRAVFSVSSWYSPAGRFDSMPPLLRPGQYTHLGRDPAAAMEAITLAGVADKVTAPLLQVCGAHDQQAPSWQAKRIAEEVAGPVTTVVYPEGLHVLNNIWHRARPLIADWLAETL